MFLKTLRIENNNGLIRNIAFRKGLNLIVDETPMSDGKSSGNNVGKTSVLRLVDFCFGGDGKNIYEDPEFKNKKNTQVKDFLIDTEVLITLTLVDDFDFPSQETEIQRNFLNYGKKILTIDGEKVAVKAFDFELKKRLFHAKVEKPTLRQIISKNIRDEKNKLINIVRVLNPYTSDGQYEALFLFWLGISTDSHNEKERLTTEKTREENYQKRLRKEGELSLTEQQLNLVNRKISDLEKQKLQFNFNEKFEKQINELNQVKLQLAKLSTNLSRLSMRRQLILESKADLENEKSHINVSRIESLYKKAAKLIPDLQVSFQETVNFHNHLLMEKIHYVTNELPTITQELDELKKQFHQLRNKERELSGFIGTSEYNEDYEKILNELNQLFEQKGNLEERKSLWKRSNDKLNNIDSELEAINKGIQSKDDLIQSRITVFNQYFSKMSDKLYGEEYLLSSQQNDKGYDLIVTNLEGNPSSGKKKGQIAAFDFAYIEFAEAIGIDLAHFIMHDQLEHVHDNQLSTILVDLANSINCQFVLPIVKDKIPADLDIEDYVILTLSENEKLFKI